MAAKTPTNDEAVPAKDEVSPPAPAEPKSDAEKSSAAPARPPMSSTDRLVLGATVVLALVLVLVRLGSFGIWDPWELSAADLARNLSEGETPPVPTLGPWLVSQGFAIFGISEWAGRLPMAVAGLLTLLVVGVGVARAAGRSTGAIAVLVTASTPMFLLNSRSMMGVSPGFLGSALIFFCALELASVEPAERADADRARPIAAVGLLLGIVIATLASGALLGVAPPILGIGAALLARGDVSVSDRTPRAMIATGMVVLAAVIGLGVARAVLADVAGYSAWLGGAPRAAQPGTFEVVIEQVFHGFAPWTAVLPLGFGWLAFRDGGWLAARDSDAATGTADEVVSRRASVLGLGAVAWAAFAFAAVSMYAARYGTAPYPAPVALGIIATIGITEAQRRGSGSWAAGLVAALLALLLLRDFRGYPVTPTGGLALAELTAPEAFNPILGWVATLVPFAVLAFLGMARDREESMAAFREDLGLGEPPRRVALGVLKLGVPERPIRAALAKGGAHAVWLWVFLALLIGVLTFGILSWTLPDDTRPQGVVAAAIVAVAALSAIVRFALRFRPAISPAVMRGIAILAAAAAGIALATGILSIEGLSSFALRIGRYLLLVPFGLVIGIAAFRAARFGFHALGDASMLPMVAMGVITGVFVSQVWQPDLSQHFSPREVYDTYNALAQDGEVLGEYHVSGRAAAYYTEGEIEELENEGAAITFLEREGRVWLAFRADDLASLDRAYRARTSRHLFIADARSSNVLLATNQPIDGRADANYLADAILDEVPEIEFPVGASFDRRIELIGYDLETPRNGRLGPGDPFVVTWYWRCVAPVPGSYTIFLHVDGMGQRLNGDHEPVDGRYPVRLWSAGDIIVDRQEMRVPANYPPGTYSFNIGFYSGETRLEVVEGREDDANRAIAGTITVR